MTRVRFEGKVYLRREDEDVLTALLRGGAKVPFSCRKGSCHTCMLRVSAGDPGEHARAGLRDDLRAVGCFLPCACRPDGDIDVARPDASALSVAMHVQDKSLVAPGVARISLECETNFAWTAGQYLHIVHPSGAVRPYSIASVLHEDPYIDLHVARIDGGLVSSWLVDEVTVGTVLTARGPNGACTWPPTRPIDPDRPLLLVATGTGLAPIAAIARAALYAGHRGPIALYHGARSRDGLYMHDELEALATKHPQLRYVGCVSRDPATPRGARAGRALDVALAEHPDLRDWTAYFAGNPSMVADGRYRAFAAGVDRDEIYTDAFELAHPHAPEDDRKLSMLRADLELWSALGEGAKLREILEDFYTRVYADPRLSPFFHRVTKDHAIGKQYAFLADLVTGRKDYFGLKPFNAHHWMVISDELFDYRERLMESVMREHGLEERFVRRWCAIHELFRREIVKSHARGLIVDGVEHDAEKTTLERVEVSTVCDGCASEMLVGSTGRLLWRTGQLFCQQCDARRTGSRPPAP
ncbi:MAG: 2Fe-2S iron-sulfur cluster binding domain-containing protein [Myxococcales bacterium]|nr:2Fe-2S iron-sulfur cluster binding domain-containing protein [Myxococcales bacterium]